MSTDRPVPEPEPTAPAVDATSAEIPQASSPPPHGWARPFWALPAATGVLGLLIGAGGMAAISANRSAAADRADQAVQEAADQGVADTTAAQAAVLTHAVAVCEQPLATGIDLGDGGMSLTFDMMGKDDSSGAQMGEIACLFGNLDMPSAVQSHIDQTTSMDGRQTETWDNLTISWSYHPDRGLDGVLTITDS